MPGSGLIVLAGILGVAWSLVEAVNRRWHRSVVWVWVGAVVLVVGLKLGRLL
jgi:hypothetical protein